MLEIELGNLVGTLPNGYVGQVNIMFAYSDNHNSKVPQLQVLLCGFQLDADLILISTAIALSIQTEINETDRMGKAVDSTLVL